MTYKSLIPFIIYPILLIYLTTFGTPFTVTSIFSIVGGMLSVSLFEYILHRFAFHNRKLPKKVKRLVSHGHVYHHRYPLITDNLVLPISITLPISLLLLSIFYLSFGTAYLFWFYLGEVMIYYMYEFMHYSAHHLPIQLPYFTQMREHHLKHHLETPNSRFMITTPLWDWVFRTYK